MASSTRFWRADRWRADCPIRTLDLSAQSRTVESFRISWPGKKRREWEALVPAGGRPRFGGPDCLGSNKSRVAAALCSLGVIAVAERDDMWDDEVLRCVPWATMVLSIVFGSGGHKVYIIPPQDWARAVSQAQSEARRKCQHESTRCERISEEARCWRKIDRLSTRITRLLREKSAGEADAVIDFALGWAPYLPDDQIRIVMPLLLSLRPLASKRQREDLARSVKMIPIVRRSAEALEARRA